MRSSRKLWRLAFAGLLLTGASEWKQLPLMGQSAPEARPMSIDGAVSADDTNTLDPRKARLPSSGHSWNAIADYTFDSGSNEISDADGGKAREVAARLREVPSLRIGIDGQNVRRVDAVRDELIAAGVPSFKIQMDVSGAPQQRTDARVVVLVNE